MWVQVPPGLPSERGGIGIHSRLKICRSNPCGFESRRSHYETHYFSFDLVYSGDVAVGGASMSYRPHEGVIVALVAQWIEQRISNPQAAGSNPAGGA
jgi:hypothetical protein